MQENQRKFCRVCGKEMSPTALFCSECSTPVNGNYASKQLGFSKMDQIQPGYGDSFGALLLCFANLPIILFLRILVQESYMETGGWRSYETAGVPKEAQGFMLALAIVNTIIAMCVQSTEIGIGKIILRYILTIAVCVCSIAVIYMTV